MSIGVTIKGLSWHCCTSCGSVIAKNVYGLFITIDEETYAVLTRDEYLCCQRQGRIPYYFHDFEKGVLLGRIVATGLRSERIPLEALNLKLLESGYVH